VRRAKLSSLSGFCDFPACLFQKLAGLGEGAEGRGRLIGMGRERHCVYTHWTAVGFTKESAKRESRARSKPKRRAYVSDNLQDLAYAEEGSRLTGAGCHAMMRYIGR
jgi:hypothetical protein